MTTTTSDSHVFGREEVVARLASSPAGVWLVTGDSGIGKSTVLRAACEQANAHAPQRPFHATHSESLDVALLRGLADTAYALAAGESDTLADIARRTVDASGRLARRHLSQVPTMLAQALLARLEALTGLPIGDLADDVREALDADDPAALALTAEQAAGQGAAQMVCELLAELGRLADGAAVVVAIDLPDELSDGDRRLLADVSASLPERAAIWLGLPTPSPSSVRTVRRLRAESAVNEEPIDPLTPRAVADWLEALGHSPALAHRLHRITNGYPIVIETMLQGKLTRRRLQLAESQDYDELVSQMLADMPADLRRAAKRLALFGDPPPDDVWPHLLGVSSEDCYDIRFHLRERRLFTVSFGERDWFHERRRVAIVRRAMGDSERSALAAEVATAIFAAVIDGTTRASAIGRLRDAEVPIGELERLCTGLARALPDSDRAWEAVNEAVTDRSLDEKALIAAAAWKGGVSSTVGLMMVMVNDRGGAKADAAEQLLRRPGLPRSVLQGVLSTLGGKARAEAEVLLHDDVAEEVKGNALSALSRREAERHARRLAPTATSGELRVACLKFVKGRHRTDLARQIVADPTSPPDAVARALVVMPRDLARPYAADLLRDARHQNVVSACLRVLGPAAGDRALDLVRDPATPTAVVCLALHSIADAALLEQEAARLLVERTEPEIVSLCLGSAGDAGLDYARRVLDAPGAYEDQVLARSVALVGAERPDVLHELLLHENPPVTSVAAGVLGDEALDFARAKLRNWRHEPVNVLGTCAQVAGGTSEARQAAREMLEDFNTIVVPLRALALRVRDDGPLRLQRADEVLANWVGRPRILTTAALTAYWADPAAVADVCAAIMGRWKQEIAWQHGNDRALTHVGHIEKALRNPHCEEAALRCARQIVGTEQQQPGWVPDRLLKAAQAALAGEQNPWAGR